MAKKAGNSTAKRTSGKRALVPKSAIPKSADSKPGTPKSELPPGDVLAGDRFPIVGLGASAGGLEAFTAFLKALPANTGMGFVLIQHLDPTHESALVSLLQRATKIPIQEATDGTKVAPNRVYILPPNTVMTIAGGALLLKSRGTPATFRDYPIDHFFVSLAEDLKSRAIGIVLSGTASDGTRGLIAIKSEGGITFAQDTASARYSSMPASAAASGCVDFTLPPAEIAKELSRINGHSYMRRVPAADGSPVETMDGQRAILRQIRAVAGVDLELYKPAMIGRRIARRMALQKIDSCERYLAMLRKDRAELNALYEDIFIHVTGFFRDPESLQALRQRVLANFVPAKTRLTVRIWVPGCSSGEEVYSIAMLLFEQLGDRRNDVALQIFGTDISERSVQRARAGIYAPASMVDVSAERQRRFFSRVDGSFQIIKPIRDTCVFARHDLSKDPPFSRMDLISCRNVLIYMGPALQKRVIEAFHYALNPGGHLLLGKSESLSAYSSLFSVVDSKHKILVRGTLASPMHVHGAAAERVTSEKAPPAPAASPAFDTRREAERVILERYSPPALVVDSNLQIVHLQGNVGPFLAPTPGEPSFHLVRMMRPELLAETRAAIHEARKESATVRREGIRFRRNGDSAVVDIHVSPMQSRHSTEDDFLVVFREMPAPPPPPKNSKAQADKAKDGELVRKERELANLRDQLHNLLQDHEAADEEVRSMNEEILSSNEELQSTNEELETAKEELESTNEELTTLNDELQKRNADLSQTSDDLTNVLVAVNIPIVILDSEMRIRRFTPAAGEVLNLIGSDVGRPLSDIAATLQGLEWKDLTRQIVRNAQPIEREVQDVSGRWYDLRMRPYRSGADRVDGVLIALIDVDTIKRSREEVEEVRRRAEDLEARLALAGEDLRVGMWEYNVASDEMRGSRQWAALYGVTPNKPLSRKEWLQRVHPEDRAGVQQDIEQITIDGLTTSREYRVVWPDGSAHWLNRRCELVRDAHGNPARIRGVSIDISDRKQVDRERQEFSSRIASVQEAERRRIARELHDGLVQELAGLAMDLGRRIAEPASPRPLKSDYQTLQNRVIKAAEAARHVAYELHPTELEDLGLEAALRAYCAEFSRDNGIKVAFKTTTKVPARLKRETASCLYKVVQEGLRNVVKHSGAKRAKVTLDRAGKNVRLHVSDQGKGFRLSSLRGSDGLGIASMRERVELVNGGFNIVSDPGKGTQVTAEVPLTGLTRGESQ
jgi:two-component system, chemotaxis family, CheB/CheR fusion protein